MCEPAKVPMQMNGKTVLITGGNSGLGKATARELGRRGARVVITARDAGKGEQAERELRRETGADVTWMNLDLASLASVTSFAEEFLRCKPELHVLINNAGVLLSQRQETVDGMEMTWAVNHVGHFLLTELLLPCLRTHAPARIVVVSSQAHYRSWGLSFDDLYSVKNYQAYRVYADTKLANLYFSRELARRLRGSGVMVNAVHPGLVATGFAAEGDARGPLAWFYRYARPFMRTPEQGAQTILYAATAPELEGVSGEYFSNSRRARPSRMARNDVAARKLWALTAELIARCQQAG
jgi:NAD(P)-dependent dehydrogenase (short-subunit alcohol dehydrogenase family)